MNNRSSNNGKYTIIDEGTKWNKIKKTAKAERSNSIIINVVIVAVIGKISLGKYIFDSKPLIDINLDILVWVPRENIFHIISPNNRYNGKYWILFPMKVLKTT